MYGHVYDSERKTRASWSRLWPSLGSALLFTAAGASASSDQVALKAERSLVAGAASTLTLVLDLPTDAAAPLIVTASAEGQALDVVRGRLLSSDAREVHDHHYVFDLPVVCRAPGKSIVRAHVRYFRCTDVCVAVESETSAVIEVISH